MITWQTLHDPDELPGASHIAYAIADLGRDKLELARVHLDEWDSLIRMGIPKKFVRELLAKTELPDAEPMDHVRPWAASSPRSALVLVGAVGTSKSYAAAWWALQRLRAGDLTHWESCATWSSFEYREFRDMRKRLATTKALVLDDLGAAGFSKLAIEHLEGLLVDRHAAELPTVVALNGTMGQLIEMLGGRVVDRIAGEGGAIVGLRQEASLRRAPPNGLDLLGRDRRWTWAKWLIDVVGCEMIARGSHEDGSFTESARYCVDLAQRVSNWPAKSSGWIDELEKVRKHMGIHVSALVDRAKELEAEAARSPMDLLWSKEMGQLRANAAKAAVARESKGQAWRPRGVVFHASPGRTAEVKIPGFDVPALNHSELVDLGVSFRFVAGEGFEVRLGKHTREGERHKGDPKAFGFASSDAAMDWARTLFATPADVERVVNPEAVALALADDSQIWEASPRAPRGES